MSALASAEDALTNDSLTLEEIELIAQELLDAIDALETI